MTVANAIAAGDADKMKAAAEVFATCSPITDASPCEAATKIGACMFMESMKRKLDFEF
jgi:hypothetical protein